MPARSADGGAPLLGEPLSIEFANTHFAVRGRIRDGIATPEHLTGWLNANAAALAMSDAALDAPSSPIELAPFHELRDAIRGVCRACVDGRPADEDFLAVINRAAAGAPGWPELQYDGSRFSTVERSNSSPGVGALAAIARSAIEVFCGPSVSGLRACSGPGCVLFFIKDHSRREWCSAGCGNRARAARHYRRHRAAATGPADR